MKSVVALLGVVVLLTACSRGPEVVAAAEARAHVGREARVRGTAHACVACAHGPEGQWKICLDAPCGQEPFAAILPRKVAEAYGVERLKALEGRVIEVHGTITLFNDRPEIVLHCPSCLTEVP